MIYGKTPEQIFEECKNTTMQIFNVLPTYLSLDKISIDIGAGIGTTAYYFSKYSKEVHCFEPLPNHIGELKSYKLPKVITYDIALSDKEGVTNLYINFSASTLIPMEKWDTIKVKTRTLDSYNFTNVNFIKIDVEGNELNVLKGARKTIEHFRPVMLVEIIQKQLKHNAKDIFAFLSDYESYYFDRGLQLVKDIPMVTDVEQERLQSYDILFLPKI